jgi:hypothetical protein
VAYEKVYRIIGGFLYAAKSSLKRVTGRIFSISNYFQGWKQVKTLSFIFSITRQQTNLKTIGAYTESTDQISKTFKNIIHLVTLSL